MKVKVARTAGFCMGVRRAANLVIEATRNHPPPISTLGPLIHNPQVVDILSQQGVKAVAGIPDFGAVVIRSHGVNPSVKRELRSRGLAVIDATCPRVARAQAIAGSRHKKGFLVVVHGDPGHAEVEAIRGFAGERAIVIQGPEEVGSLPEADKVCLVAQTTQEREAFERTAAALRERYRHLPAEALEIADTICDSTRSRQDEVRRLADEVEALVVVGGRESANTRRLAEVARERGLPVFAVESEDELPVEDLASFKVVGLTAGASTPNWVIRRVYEKLREIKRRRGFFDRLLHALRFLVLANLYVAAGAGALTVAAGRLQGFWPLWSEVLISMLFVFAAHTMTLIADARALALNVPFRARIMSRYRRAWIAASMAAAAAAVGLGFMIQLSSGLFMLGLAVVSLLYPVRLIRSGPGQVPIRSLAEVPASKDVFMALGWAALIVVLPLFSRGAEELNLIAAVIAFGMVGGLAFVRALLRDFRDIQADRLIGRETLPIVLGAGRTRMVLYFTLVAIGLALIAGAAAQAVSPPIGYLLLAPLIYAAACVPLFTRQTIIQGFRAEGVIDAVFYIAGLCALLAGAAL